MRKYIKRKYYSISKYNPIFRNKNGDYLKNEWTSYSDIGKSYEGVIFNKNDYESIEILYINSAIEALTFFNSKRIIILSILKNSDKADFIKNEDIDLFPFYEKIKAGEKICDESAFQMLMKLRLREYLGELDLLIELKSRTEITFGFDFYMYIKTNKDIAPLKEKISNIGLFWE